VFTATAAAVSTYAEHIIYTAPMTNQTSSLQPPGQSHDAACVFCAGSGGDVLFEDDICRVVLVTGDEGEAFPGFCRVISNRHVEEVSDLAANEQNHLFTVVMATEMAIRKVQRPDKMNLASLGNVVAHVHWHVIPRWMDDSHFPGPIWATAKRNVPSRQKVNKAALYDALELALRA
jgi:diadenosine tetraphosphate (Ap4A) HIT family hydrolase